MVLKLLLAVQEVLAVVDRVLLTQCLEITELLILVAVVEVQVVLVIVVALAAQVM